jgi:hypothetical protein
MLVINYKYKVKDNEVHTKPIELIVRKLYGFVSISYEDGVGMVILKNL